MTNIKRKSKSKSGKLFKQLVSFSTAFLLLFSVMYFGSQGKELNSNKGNPIISAINDSDFIVTADQLSESYMVADLANTVNLPSLYSINENYASIAMKYEITGSTSHHATTIKTDVIDVSDLPRGIIERKLGEGETLASIAAEYEGLTVNQIRWSNKLKNDSVKVGQTIYIPTIPGIIYTVKAGDTLTALAEKYKSSIEQIIPYNDLENGDIAEGMTIILPSGELPEKERPEYVAPVVRPVYYSSSVRDSGVRYNIQEVASSSYWRAEAANTSWQGNPGAFGNCTWYAWYWRRNNKELSPNYQLPSGVIGNAGTWTYMSWSSQFFIDKLPRFGAVVQTSTGSPGHVGVITRVDPGVSITIEEMNFHGGCGYKRCGYNRVFRSQINWAEALRYNYIHGRK